MKAILIIAFKDYQDVEFGDTHKALLDGGVEVKVASTETGESQGALGGSQVVDMTLEDVNVSDYDLVAFIGGGGAIEYFDNKEAHRIAQDALREDKILSAICCAPMILYRAGVMKDKKFTVWPDADWVKEMSTDNEYIDQEVVEDGKMITAPGPQFAKDFGKKLVEKLS